MPRAGPGREVFTESTAGSSEAIAPTMSTRGDACWPPARTIVTRSWYDVTPSGTTQVSTFTEPRSSPWLPYVVRWKCRSPAAQVAIVSQLEVAVSVRPRTSMRTRLSPGVRADHDGISRVSAKPGVVHGVAH